MTTQSLKDATDAVYRSLENDNEDIDLHIAALKAAMGEAGEAQAVFEAGRLPQNNREGRKMMQSYFKKRGVRVIFN
ncbi:MAG: hypothetical protein IT559_02370 [Alphaproteobacteria bacterium]|nr:hypothetical protein [Alphaproteobacteria bacterium]